MYWDSAVPERPTGAGRMSGLDRRVARLETVARPTKLTEKEAARHRISLRMRAKIYALVRNRLEAMGIDPEFAPALRVGKEAAAELAAIPDTLELETADQAILRVDRVSEGNAADQLREKILAMAERYRDGHRPDFANASLLDLFAFVVGPDPEK
jgi:hypothetical protein